jgi:hypothetical protein
MNRGGGGRREKGDSPRIPQMTQMGEGGGEREPLVTIGKHQRRCRFLPLAMEIRGGYHRKKEYMNHSELRDFHRCLSHAPNSRRACWYPARDWAHPEEPPRGSEPPNAPGR